jgi:plasmid stability protein
MATITVRNLDDEVQRRLKRRAAEHNRSMESEARAILTAAVARADVVHAWLEATVELRGDDIDLPVRSAPRELDLA